jgi:hypothetical protein
MKKKFDQVYQFKITLQDIKPPIWRRIQVPETYTFYDFHVAIQDAMGWLDYHLHEFSLIDPRTGLNVEIGFPVDDFGRNILTGWNQKINDYFSIENDSADYVYDFGDFWRHKILLEDIIPRDRKIKYPVCIKGKRACPPEDVGGVGGYEDFIKIKRNPKHKEYEDMLEWAGAEFDPEFFDPEEVIFDDPAKRRKMAME